MEAESRVSFELCIKPLSINAAFVGRRFKTPESKQYDRTLDLLLPKRKVAGKFYKVWYDFALKNFMMTDYDNLIKQLQDGLVRNGIISDDRKIIEAHIRKMSANTDSVYVAIEGI